MSSPLNIPISGLKEPGYIGSVQNLFFPEDHPEIMVCETTSGGSVFDVGTIFSIPGSDVCRAALRHKIYGFLASPSKWGEVLNSGSLPQGIKPLARTGFAEKLKRSGAKTHHVGMIDEQTGEVYESSFPETPSRYVAVRRYQVMKPGRFYLDETPLWDYSAFYHADRYVVPLENIVRFGITPSSSIYRKYLSYDNAAKEAYLSGLGVKEALVPWQLFAVPIVDHTTKYEPEDRNLGLQEALYVSGCDGETLVHLRVVTVLASYMVSSFFRDLGLLLWDLKWEIAKDGDDLVIVDTIDTDSLRVTTEVEAEGSKFHVHFNKQSMRDYYKIMHAKWISGITDAKQKAKETGKPFHEHLEEGVRKGTCPPVPDVDPGFLGIQAGKFSALLDYVRDQATIQETMERIQNLAREEVRYYAKHGALEEFGRINQV